MEHSIVDWTQYPLIAIILVVVWYAQKISREDRRDADMRSEKRLDAYTQLVENTNRTIANNTQALGDIEKLLARELNGGNGK